MPQPRVSWYTRDNTAPITSWDIGTVDAGNPSTPLGVLIWNNRGQSTAVSDMQNCKITTKDAGGLNQGELVLDKWIEVKVDALSETTFTRIGGVNDKAIRANGTTTMGLISGAANDGTLAATENFCELTLRANPLPTATAGLVNFLTRVSYQYV